MPSASERVEEPFTPDSDIFGFAGWNGWHAMTPENAALTVCFGCGDPLCETDYVEWTEFLPTDDGPAPDPVYVGVCEGCSYVWEAGTETEDFYTDREASSAVHTQR